MSERVHGNVQQVELHRDDTTLAEWAPDPSALMGALTRVL